MPDYGLPFFHTDAFASAAAGVVVRFFRVHDFLLAACSARCGAICWHWHLFILTEKTAKRQKRAKSTKVKQEDLWGFRLVGFVICCGGAPPFTFFSLFSLAYVFVCSIWFCFYYWLSSLLAARLRKAPLHLTSHSFRRVGLSCCNNIPLFWNLINSHKTLLFQLISSYAPQILLSTSSVVGNAKSVKSWKSF